MEHIHLWQPGKSGRTLLLLHGTGGNERDLLSIAETVSPDANVLAVRGRSLDEGMNRFFLRLAEGVFDEADLLEKTEELADFLVSASSRYGFALNQTIAVGYSNGANIAAAMLLLRPETLQGGILLRAMVPFRPDVLPVLAGKQVLLNSGESDPILPLDNANELARMFRESGASVQHEVLGTGHNLTKQDLTLAKNWLGNVMACSPNLDPL